MNACVRAVARCALARCCIPYAVLEGYQGLVDGGDKVKRVGWEDLRGIMPLGGTVIGSARCLPFRSRPGRLAACLNMVKLGIDALIVVGGDGSLTGADILRAEWAGLVEELAKEGKVTQEEATGVGAELKIVGLVGSIDNDMAMTDITIGANTSLHRICEALDSIVSTALSHQRAFVVEVMGRHCGWLALMAAIAVGADWVFLPERPPPMTSRYPDWESEMCALLQRNKEMGNRKALIIVCEGAIDQSLQPLKPEKVKEVIEKRLGLDTRVTTLGHIQRGGTPSAYDRFLATVQGARAVDAVLEANPTTMSPMIGMSENQVTSVPLMEAVKTTKEVANCVSRKDFAAAMDLRDPEFKHAYDAYIESTLLADAPLSNSVPATHRLRVGICHVGAPAGGMNAATRSAVRLLLNRGHTPLGFSNGFQGLVDGDVKTLNWQDVNGWTTRGGSELGTNRVQPAPLPEFLELGLLAYSFQKWGLQALLVIGGFEGFTSVLNLSRARALYPAFCIPIIHLPATVSNNVPGTDYSLGSDTALNAIVEACDRIKLSAAASRKRVFIVEVQGGECGYLATLGGLAAGATTSYIPEEGLNLARIQTDIQHLKRRYIEEDQRGIANEGRVILRNEAVGAKTYTTEQLANIIRDEAKGLFDARTAVLGHLQQGGVPSPLDRCRAVRLAVNCVDWLERVAFESLEKKLNGSNTDVNRDSDDIKSTRRPNVYCPDSDTACVIGIRGAQVTYSPVESVAGETNLTKRKATMRPWWLELQGLTR
ncbi:6-phosphofructokinase [Gonapodya prolifera JEL478]|uniref:6-phosphofructokinase n=1 Tax=Gonapodya prolifera (strain JEL478) TaxID=1344416 RepID=A0A139AL43_GONPJ|nr:6-phosphofructokinase [Gonapodya prolifera JEL478]|eukprot:KXS17418.1 6-phosphofructokinase [Gonapodya prolifera JEL478]